MESAELQVMHNSKKQMDTVVGRHDLPSQIKAQEIWIRHVRRIAAWHRSQQSQIHCTLHLGYKFTI